jgi:hypothetical protein
VVLKLWDATPRGGGLERGALHTFPEIKIFPKSIRKIKNKNTYRKTLDEYRL